MALLWSVLEPVWDLLAQKVSPVLSMAQLDSDLVECRYHKSEQLVGATFALPYPFIGYQHLLPASYLEFITLLPIVHHPLLGFIILLDINWQPLLGFLCLQ